MIDQKVPTWNIDSREVPEAQQMCTNLSTDSFYAVVAVRYGFLCVEVIKDV
jgi:hypothetical protein